MPGPAAAPMRAIPILSFVLFLALLGLHAASPRARAWTWKAVGALALALGVSGAWVGLSWSPTDHYMGVLSRIMFVHVPLVWTGLLALGVNFFASVAWLFGAGRTADATAEAAAEVGVWLGLVGLAVGSVWGYPTWGVWWSWDPRLSAAAAMLVFYGGYLALRRLLKDEARRAQVTSTYALVISVILPVVVFSVRWWPSLHQLQSTPHTLDPDIFTALLWNALAWLCGFFVLVYLRYGLGRARLERAAPA